MYILCPNYQVQIDRVESIQKKLLCFVFKKLGLFRYVEFDPCGFKIKLLCLKSLADRQINACKLFMYDDITRRLIHPIFCHMSILTCRLILILILLGDR